MFPAICYFCNNLYNLLSLTSPWFPMTVIMLLPILHWMNANKTYPMLRKCNVHLKLVQRVILTFPDNFFPVDLFGDNFHNWCNFLNVCQKVILQGRKMFAQVDFWQFSDFCCFWQRKACCVTLVLSLLFFIYIYSVPGKCKISIL